MSKAEKIQKVINDIATLNLRSLLNSRDKRVRDAAIKVLNAEMKLQPAWVELMEAVAQDEARNNTDNH